MQEIMHFEERAGDEVPQGPHQVTIQRQFFLFDQW